MSGVKRHRISVPVRHDAGHGREARCGVQEKERFNKIAEELTELSTKFGNNVLDATKAYTKLLTTEEEAAGLPESARALMAQQAKAKGHEDATPEKGPWLVTLDIPSYLPVQVHCSNRGVREEVYRAFVTRASEGERDNTPVIMRILQLRKEKAALLGYEHHAAVSMASKARSSLLHTLLRDRCVSGPPRWPAVAVWRACCVEGRARVQMADLATAEKLLEELRESSFEPGKRELQETREYAAKHGAEAELMNWDLNFWSERMKEDLFAINDEKLRPYFALPTVLEGLFGVRSPFQQLSPMQRF